MRQVTVPVVISQFGVTQMKRVCLTTKVYHERVDEPLPKGAKFVCE